MFTYLSDSKKITQILTAFSADELRIATKNINTLDKRLQLPVIELLNNRKKQGKLFIDSAVASKNVADNPLVLSPLLLSETALISQVNRLCLSEANIVRDTLLNGLDAIALQQNASGMQSQQVKTLRLRLTGYEKNECEKSESTTAIVPPPSPTANNVMPIQLIEVKQRLAQALHVEAAEKLAIKNKLNSLLADTTETKEHDAHNTETSDYHDITQSVNG